MLEYAAILKPVTTGFFIWCFRSWFLDVIYYNLRPSLTLLSWAWDLLTKIDLSVKNSVCQKRECCQKLHEEWRGQKKWTKIKMTNPFEGTSRLKNVLLLLSIFKWSECVDLVHSFSDVSTQLHANCFNGSQISWSSDLRVLIQVKTLKFNQCYLVCFLDVKDIIGK